MTIVVSHSFVRPNDRGKESPSFIVTVNPGNEKEGWKVEKMYSGMVSLNQRVRNSVSEEVGKKIANLPEGKLWKDHAPAKVDRRNAVLKNYLQSLMLLPVKNNFEVIAFLTSGVYRPVVQTGHKEGYLMKRGKNFGGWKTRFFVLKNAVLEYYDRRGGAYLDSIAIAGAQIARQMRTEGPPSNDEDELRHGMLIVEAKTGPGGAHPRHVLCAESDEERDSWVEMLVRYHSGTYKDDPVLEEYVRTGIPSRRLEPSPVDRLESTLHTVAPSPIAAAHLAYSDLATTSMCSLASSRTASTDYGLYFTRWAVSQETVLSQDRESARLPRRRSWDSFWEPAQYS